MQGMQVQSLVCEDVHTSGQLSPGAATTEPLSPRSATREATAMRHPRTTVKTSLHSPQLEKACARSNKDPAQPKIKKINENK